MGGEVKVSVNKCFFLSVLKVGIKSVLCKPCDLAGK